MRSHTVHLDKGTLVAAGRDDAPREIPAPDLGGAVPAQDAHRFHAAVGACSLPAVRIARFRAQRVRRARAAMWPAWTDLVTVSKISFTMQLPKSLFRRISATPDVAEVTLRQLVRRDLSGPEEFLSKLRRGARTIWICIRSGSFRPPSVRRFATHVPARSSASSWRSASIGRSATKFRCRPPSFRKKSGSNNWTLDLVGMFHEPDPKLKGQESQLFFNWDYFDEARAFGNGNVGWYVDRA